MPYGSAAGRYERQGHTRRWDRLCQPRVPLTHSILLFFILESPLVDGDQEPESNCALPHRSWLQWPLTLWLLRARL